MGQPSPITPDPLGQKLVGSQATDIGLVGICCFNDLVKNPDDPQDSEQVLRAGGASALLDRAQSVFGEPCPLGQLGRSEPLQLPPRRDVRSKLP
jgi:hypothetical protein